MRRRRIGRWAAGMALAGLLACGGAGPARAQEVAPAFRADILRLLKATGTEAVVVNMAQMASSNVMDAMVRQAASSGQDTTGRARVLAVVKDELGRIFTDEAPKLLDGMVPLYARHFTAQEVKGMLAFWEGPLGQKTVREMPALMGEGAELGRQWGEKIMPAAMARVQARLEREGLKLE